MDIDFPENEANGKDFDFPTDEKELAALGIFTPIEKRYYKKQPYWVVPNQKILVVHPSILPRELVGYTWRGEKDTEDTDLSPKPKLSFFARLLRLILLFFFPKRWPKPLPKPKFVKDKEGQYTFQAFFENERIAPVTLRIVRANECPNDPNEFDGNSISILVEWPLRLFRNPPGDLIPFNGLLDQVDNQLFINPDPNNRPGHPPPRSLNDRSEITKVYDTDFKVFDYGSSVDSDKSYYEPIANDHSDEPIVAVMDTGLAYKAYLDGQLIRAYDRNGNDTDFKIARAQSNTCTSGADFGYCCITDYLRRPVLFSQLIPLNSLSASQILTSPYDDNLVDDKVGDTERKMVGRHGTLIAALLNHMSCQVLPVKAFNCAGRGTLNDVLSGCNYILSRKQAGVPIRVLNASFNGTLDKKGRKLLFNKFKALTDNGIWVVVAAGNEGINLDQPGNSRYPAQFGLPVAKGGLEKVITVTSAYLSPQIVGNSGTPVSLKARSPLADGFPSVLPTISNSSLTGTSFAAPYAAGVLAHADPNLVTSRVQALEYLRSNPVPNPNSTTRQTPPADINFENP